MLNRIQSSSILVCVIPFAAFAILTLFQGRLGDESQYCVYALKTVVGAWILWLMRSHIGKRNLNAG
jgi:hypothetical protein